MLVSITGVIPDGSDTGTAQPQTISSRIGETLTVTCTVKDSTGALVNLGSNALVLTVKSLLTGSPVISRQATITAPSSGVGVFPFVIADTIYLKPDKYAYDVQLRYAPGGMVQIIPVSTLSLSQPVGQTGEAVTVPTAQQPLATGPVGPTGLTGPAGPSVPLASTTPLVAGVGAVGTGTTASRADHVHPSEVPAQAGNAGKVLGTNGAVTSWVAQSAGSGLPTATANRQVVAQIAGAPAFTDPGSLLATTSLAGFMSSADKAYLTVTSSRSVVATLMAGGDLGAQINAACAALGGPGTVVVPDGNYTITTRVLLTPGVKLKLGNGIITNSINGIDGNPLICMQDNCTIEGAGWGTVVHEVVLPAPNGNVQTICDYKSFGPGGSLVGKGNKTLTIRDLQLRGNPATATVIGNVSNTAADVVGMTYVAPDGTTKTTSVVVTAGQTTPQVATSLAAAFTGTGLVASPVGGVVYLTAATSWEFLGFTNCQPGGIGTGVTGTVEFGSCENVLCQNVYVNGTRGYGISQASYGDNGNSMNGFRVINCTFDEVPSQNLVCTNAVDMHFEGNTFRRTWDAVTFIDIEMNGNADMGRCFTIVNNRFFPVYQHAINSQIAVGAIFIQGAFYPAGTSRAGTAYGGIISNNVIDAGDQNTVSFCTQGINLYRCREVLISNNMLRYVSSEPILLNLCHSNVIQNNAVHMSGSAGQGSIRLINSVNTWVDGNHIFENFGDVTNAHSQPIVAEISSPDLAHPEYYAPDYNLITNNRLIYWPPAVVSGPAAQDAYLMLVGLHTRAYNNVCGTAGQGAIMDFPALQNATELRLANPGFRNAAVPALACISGKTTPGDGGGGLYIFDSTNVATDDGYMVVKPQWGPTGSWLRQKGLPVFTTTARNALGITSGYAGMLIWNSSTGAVEVYNGTAWGAVTGGGGGGGGGTAIAPTSTQTSAYAAGNYQLVRCNPSGAGFTVTLPTAAGANIVIVKNQSNSSNTITVVGAGTDTVDGIASFSLSLSHAGATFYSDGVSDWMIE